MHHICEVLDWPSVHDLYPFVGMRAERRTKRKSPARGRPVVKSLAAPDNAAQGACTPVDSTCHQLVTGQIGVSGLRLDYVLAAQGMCLDAPYRVPRGSLKGYDCYSGGYQVDSVELRGGRVVSAQHTPFSFLGEVLMSTSRRDHALMAAAALLSEFVEDGKPIQRKDARDVLGQLRKARAAMEQQDAQAVPQGWRELLQQSKENCRYNHGYSSLADWIYASIEDLFARRIAAPTPPAQQSGEVK